MADTGILHRDEERVVFRTEQVSEELLLEGGEGSGRGERDKSKKEEIHTSHDDGGEITELTTLPPIEQDSIIKIDCTLVWQ